MIISAKTQLLGLIGWPVSHSFSPAMHNAAAAALGLDFVYVALPVRPDAVETAVRGLAVLGFRGVNITVPHKQAVMPFLHKIEAGARAIGAVNTIVFNNQQSTTNNQRIAGVRAPIVNPKSPIVNLVGYNTDWSGFLADLASLGVAVNGRSCLVLGAGGSARAVAYGLAQAGGQVQVLARRLEQAQQLVDEISLHVGGAGWLLAGAMAALETAVHTTTSPLIVNTTPLGMSPQIETSAWPDSLAFPAGSFAYDLVYNPATTRFRRQAEAHGCQSANGLGMLLHQGAQAFARFTGQEPDLEVMKTALFSLQSRIY